MSKHKNPAGLKQAVLTRAVDVLVTHTAVVIFSASEAFRKSLSRILNFSFHEY
eukprot:COSAG02_NODE_6966_length_3259_cov_961.700316_3_plen_53_part_00